MDRKDLSLLLMLIGACVICAYLPGVLLHWPLLALLLGSPAGVMVAGGLLLAIGLAMAFRLKLTLPASKTMWLTGAAVAVLAAASVLLWLLHVPYSGQAMVLLFFCALPAWLVWCFIALKNCNP